MNPEEHYSEGKTTKMWRQQLKHQLTEEGASRLFGKRVMVRLTRIDPLQMLKVRNEAPPEQRAGVDQQEPLHIKKVWSLEGQQFNVKEETDDTMFPVTIDLMKSEDEEKPLISQLHQQQMEDKDVPTSSSAGQMKKEKGEETTRNPDLNAHEETSIPSEAEVSGDEEEEEDENLDSSLSDETEDGDDWEESRASESDSSDMDSDFSGDDEINSDKENSGPRAKRRRAQKSDPDADLKGKDGTVWTREELGRDSGSEAAPVPSFKATPGPTEKVKHKMTSVLQAFLCLIDIRMLQTIRECTIQHARRTDRKWNLTLYELMAFISLLFSRAVLSPVGAMVDCWSEDFLVPAIKETMPRDRYKSIMRHLRFDNKDTREERVKGDRFAAISYIWNRFVKNCIASFNPGQHITVDEQVFPTKVRCPFTQYFSTKPDKFGIKFWIATDLETKYVCNAMPYLGKGPNRTKGERPAENVVMSIMEPFLDAGRTVTMDSFFTSLPLANRLLQRDTSLLGTICKYRRELPPSAKDTSAREPQSTAVFRSGSVMLTVYAAKKRKNVCILSSMHQKVETVDDRKKKPNTMTDYNQKKCSVEFLDQMPQSYSVRAATHRWPIAVFYNMLDLAAVNAHVLYNACTGSTDNRRQFLCRLAKELRAQLMEEKTIEKERRAKLRQAAVVPRPPPPPGKMTQCQVLQNCKRNHSKYRCVKCQLYTCAKCREIDNWVCDRCK